GRVREFFEPLRHGLFELTRGGGEIRRPLRGRAAFIGDGQELEKNDLSVAQTALESFELPRLELELRLFEQALRLGQIVRDPAAQLVELAITTRTPPISGPETRQRGQGTQDIGKALLPEVC